jgi:hypothetical protein
MTWSGENEGMQVTQSGNITADSGGNVKLVSSWTGTGERDDWERLDGNKSVTASLNYIRFIDSALANVELKNGKLFKLNINYDVYVDNVYSENHSQTLELEITNDQATYPTMSVTVTEGDGDLFSTGVTCTISSSEIRVFKNSNRQDTDTRDVTFDLYYFTTVPYEPTANSSLTLTPWSASVSGEDDEGNSWYTDLKALSDFDPTNVVTIDKSQTINGYKTFANLTTFSSGIITDGSIRGTNGANVVVNGVEFVRSITSPSRKGDIHPTSDATHNLGATTQRFNDLYLSGNISDGTNSAAISDVIAAASGGSAPSNMVTTDTAQTITGAKTFDANVFVDCRAGHAHKLYFGNPNNTSYCSPVFAGGNEPGGYKALTLNNVVASSDFSASGFYPVTHNSLDLGLSGTYTKYWKNLYLTGNISDGTNSASVANIINAGSALSGVNFNGSIVTPNTAVGSQLGGSGAQWNHLYVSGQLHCGTNGAKTAYTDDIVDMTNMLKTTPNTDGTYVLKATVSNGVATYEWVAE